MTQGDDLGGLIHYADHIGLWKNELRPWLPETLFDAHVHIGPRGVMGELSPERRREPLGAFTSVTWEDLQSVYSRLFSGKKMAGLIAFPLPLREVHLEPANRYIVAVMKRAPEVKGFLLSHPTDTAATRSMFKRAAAEGVRFSGVKPYFDLLGKSNYQTTMPEFIPESLLEFMNRERLVMMLHTSGTGMRGKKNQEFVRGVLERYPNVKIILAHMGRYLRVEDFFRFCESGLLEHPRIYLEMSSAAKAEVYAETLRHTDVWDRILFGSDIPYGLITGVEEWSAETGPVFVTRDRYPWSDGNAAKLLAYGPDQLTYNTYHTIKAFKEALESSGLAEETSEAIKKKVFCENALELFA